ncbi:hypothetical protein AB0I35_25270 [Nocardia sp. NPDC050378]|uniref:PIN-like domain-containing protein n=1 Tax=Nocardia sp. NPDC050378 TaxID=3155400 RepID=UPI0033C015BC
MSSRGNTSSTNKKSNPSSEPSYQQPPEFFLDRGLGKGVAAGLIELGWHIHRIVDHFPNDAQETTDETWIEFGLTRGWVPLCKDGRIKGRAVERAPLGKHAAVMFYLDNQQLTISAMIERVHNARAAIHHAVERGGPAAYAVTAQGIRRTWP